MIKIESLLPNSDVRGMTVVQVVVVAGLVLVVIGAGIAPYLIQHEYLKKQFTRTRLQDELSVAMSYITRDIFRSKAADLPSSTQLTLTVGTGPLPTDEETVTYSLSGTEIRRTAGGSTISIASYIRSNNGLQFSMTGNNCVNISITAQSEEQTISMESSVALRAVMPI